jgi:hypothetical protein
MTREFTAQGSPVEVLEAIDARTREAAAAGRLQTRWGCTMALCVVLAFISPIGIKEVGVAGWALLALALAIVTWGIVMQVRLAKRRFDDRKLGLASRVLAVLAEDLPRKSKCGVTVRDPGLALEGEPERDTTGFYPVKTEKWRGEWLELRGKLVDGSAFSFVIESTQWKKMKYKKGSWRVKRTRWLEELCIALQPDAEAHPTPGDIAGLAGTSTAEGMLVSRAVPPTPPTGKLTVAAEKSALLVPEDVLGLFAHVYSRLTAAGPQAGPEVAPNAPA